MIPETQIREAFKVEPKLGRSLPQLLGLSFCLLLFVAGPAVGKTHPVPLDKNVDAAKCLECHEDKTKGKAVHSAVATGCLSCHEVRVSNDITRVKLTTTTTQALCLSCHEEKKAQAGQTLHPPAVRDCVKCHDPHQSNNPNQLLKTTAGTTKDENLCLSCHNIGAQSAKAGSRHAALDMGCETCHVTHKNGDRGKVEFASHLKKDVPALCLDCHDIKDAGLQKAHAAQPFGTANCLQCHNPHESAAPKLMQSFLHSPFEGKMCDSCHREAKDGKVVLTNADSRALCLTCHEDQGKKIDSAKVQHAGAQGECIACHNPHGGKTPGFIQPNPVSACLTCHSDQSEQMKKAHLHQPAFETSCAICHEPHGGDNPKLLRASGNELCLECHGPSNSFRPVEGTEMVSIFNGTVKLPRKYSLQTVHLPIKYGLGHPTDGHPVQDLPDPTDPRKTRAKINCLTCHQPHASAQPDLLVKDQVNNMAFCDTCHKDRTMRTVSIGETK